MALSCSPWAPQQIIPTSGGSCDRVKRNQSLPCWHCPGLGVEQLAVGPLPRGLSQDCAASTP